MKIGVFDSGIGGLTTLSRLMQVCGGDYIFVRDKRGPYGDKSDEFVLSRSLRACAALRNLGAEIVVLACNTATNVAISTLRELSRDFRYIGIEPAVKPALAVCDKVAVALTPTAARQSKFKALIGLDADRIRLITLPDLAPNIEKYYSNENKMFTLAERLYENCIGCDGLVLGCTHYIFLRQYLRKLSDIKIFDGNDGVANNLKRITGYMGSPSVKFISIS